MKVINVIFVVLLSVSALAQVLDPKSCQSNTECSSTQYCFINGTCLGPGICIARPDLCPLYETVGGVCGCNHIRYGNPCLAASAGENYPTPLRPCPITDPTPPLGCSDSNGCPSGEYCMKPIGKCNDFGTCTAKPAVCNMMATVDGVCGCDGHNWPTVCSAAVNGININSTGHCITSTVGCTSNSDCTSAQYCMKPTGGCAGQGRCAFRPLRCPLPPVSINNLLCGCDGNNYTTPCAAAKAGLNIQTPAPCPPIPGTCLSDADCGSGQWCQHPANQCGTRGQCIPRRVWNAMCNPNTLCGCNGVTYASACEALNSFVSVRHSGACIAV